MGISEVAEDHMIEEGVMIGVVSLDEAEDSLPGAEVHLKVSQIMDGFMIQPLCILNIDDSGIENNRETEYFNKVMSTFKMC